MIPLTKDALHKTGLTIHSTVTGLAAYSYNLLTHPDPKVREDAVDQYASAIEMTSRLAVKIAGGHVGALSLGDYRDAKRRKFLETILAGNPQRPSLFTASESFEMFCGSPCLLREPPCTIADSKRLFRKAIEKSKVPIKLAIDTGHQCAAGVESKTTTSMHGGERLLLTLPLFICSRPMAKVTVIGRSLRSTTKLG